MTDKMDRNEFFRHAFKKVVGKGIDILENTQIAEKIESLTKTSTKSSNQKQRPPGASHDEREFLQKCTGCDACMAACPVHVIMIEDLERRDPIIYPDQSPCIHCPGYPCISSCPTGALNRDNGTKLRLV